LVNISGKTFSVRPTKKPTNIRGLTLAFIYLHGKGQDDRRSFQFSRKKFIFSQH
jgi:hypothetical protein